MNSPRTILMSADCIGGVWTYAMELIRGLDMYGIRVILVTFGRKLSAAQAREAAGLHNAEVYQSTFKLEWMEDPWDDITDAGEWLMDLQEQFGPDLVHLNHFAHGSLDWKAPVLVVGHSCVLSWWRAVKRAEAPQSWDHYAEVVRNGLRAADMVVAPSPFMLSELQRLYGPLLYSGVIPNGRQLPPSTPISKEPFVFAAGRLWDEAKNIQMLCDIAPILPWPVYVAGEPGDSVCVKHVIPLGRLSCVEMESYLGRASIYALPARYEPFGLSVLEAALAGCALVLGDIPRLRQIWEGAAVFVSPNDPVKLRHGITRLIEDKDLRETLAAAAHRTAAYYTPTRLAANYVQLYHSMVPEKTEVLCAS
ncbi:MAG TPA: glycosyltransferase family 4 protein [Verrucomicrobiae bacterium]|nr:glycosyltransferase family 4 protein [Verrucomicrobiae bacterium]